MAELHTITTYDDSTLPTNREELTKGFVSEMESRMQEAATATAGLKEIVDAARESDFSPAEIMAMRRLAKMRLADTVKTESKKLDALHRMSDAIGLDLFSWSEGQ